MKLLYGNQYSRISRVNKLFCHQRSISEQLVLFMEINSETTIKEGKFTEFVPSCLEQETPQERKTLCQNQYGFNSKFKVTKKCQVLISSLHVCFRSNGRRV